MVGSIFVHVIPDSAGPVVVRKNWLKKPWGDQIVHGLYGSEAPDFDFILLQHDAVTAPSRMLHCFVVIFQISKAGKFAGSFFAWAGLDMADLANFGKNFQTHFPSFKN